MVARSPWHSGHHPYIINVRGGLLANVPDLKLQGESILWINAERPFPPHGLYHEQEKLWINLTEPNLKRIHTLDKTYLRIVYSVTLQ